MRVAVVAPVLAMRAGIRSLLAEAGIEVAWEAASLEELEAALPQVDVLLATGESAASPGWRRSLETYAERLAVLLLVEQAEEAGILSDLPVRAWGVLPLDTDGAELAAALQALDEGLLVGSPQLLKTAFQQLAETASVRETVLAGPGALNSGESLTERESEVLQLLAQGLANKQIASRLGISEHTVKFHVSGIYSKLEASNRAEAVRVGVQRGLVLL